MNKFMLCTKYKHGLVEIRLGKVGPSISLNELPVSPYKTTTLSAYTIVLCNVYPRTKTPGCLSPWPTQRLRFFGLPADARTSICNLELCSQFCQNYYRLMEPQLQIKLADLVSAGCHNRCELCSQPCKTMRF